MAKSNPTLAGVAMAQKKKQGGFTLVELVVVLAILALIIGVMSSGIFQSQEDSKTQAARTQLLKDFPSAITRLVTMANACNNTVLTAARLTTRGVPNTTVWGGTWTITTTGGNRAVVTYPIDTNDPAIGPDLAAAVLRSDNVVAATGTAAQVQVTYRCN